MPRVALCLFVFFMAWLWRRYRKEAGPMAAALWLPFIWVAINGSRAVTYWLAGSISAAESHSVSEGNPIDRTVYLFLAFAGIAVLARRRIDWQKLIPRTRWLWVFYGYLLISTVWSDYPWISLKRWFKDFGDIVMILIILTEEDPVEAFRAVFVRFAYLFVPLSVLCIKWYPAIGRYEHRWTYDFGVCGVTGSKNMLGMMTVLCALLLLWQIVDVNRHRGKKLTLRETAPDLIVLGMCLWMLSIAQCATAVACGILGGITFIITRLRIVRINLNSFGWCMTGIILVMFALTVSLDFRRAVAGLVGRDATLTTRTEIWQRALALKTNPLVGEGFSSVWFKPEAAEMVEEWKLPHCHNGYLETYLNSGLIGVFLLVVVLYSAGANAARHVSAGSLVGPLFMAIFMTTLFINYSEVTFNRGNVLGFLLWLIALHYSPVAEAPATRVTQTFESSEAAPEPFQV